MEKFWKLPPRVKVLEALGSIADKRINIISEKKEKGKTIVKAVCISSTKDKVYTITYIIEDNAIVANDNGSKFRGYLGYPSIALLMLKKKLSYDATLAFALKGIPWKKWNEQFKNYYKTEFMAKKVAEKKGINEKKIDRFIEKVLREIKESKFKVLT